MYAVAIDVTFGDDGTHTIGAEYLLEYGGKYYFAIEPSSEHDKAGGYNREEWEIRDGMILVPVEMVEKMRYVWE